ncbi:uncharacterized protein F5Z01DRAFT_672852 [Emericellopsis atlantica]|uniref:Uncharacterized protein n=1 Tax=Emericellopsis atlantica TaxID=2614577 RepID=A0A9P8CQV7_9HYPO|nr:uncharacterized protein F5Z01DRAFT_672852 [Emericellopsis atlantica]KAG9255540.1 hypothetical protein F5Z01DRAFT_672852 [Emericellopsis atlantica]
MDALKSLGDATFLPSERAMLNMLKGVLEYPATMEARAAKIANDILHFYLDNTHDDEVGGMLFALWGVWLELVSCILHGHEWHQCLALAVDFVRQDERAAGKGLTKWPDPPELSMRLTEQWELKPVEGEENDSVGLSAWKNLNSFMSHLVSRGLVQQVHLPIWEIRSALEEPAAKGPLMDCRVWVATEWTLHCSDTLEKEMKSTNEELTEDEAGIRGTGQLCDDSITPRSLQRWEFWKERLAEIATEADDLEWQS